MLTACHTFTGHIVIVCLPAFSDICLLDCCPEDKIVYLPAGSDYNCTTVSWIEPIAIDYSGQYVTPIQTHYPCDAFPIGFTLVQYAFEGDGGTNVTCQFGIEVRLDGECYLALIL